MKISAYRKLEMEPVAIRVCAAVRYDEEDMPNDFPFRAGDVWDVTVDIDTGRIRDWPAGRTATVHMKVCDQGSYYLLVSGDAVLASVTEDYVPGCIPGSYGDYVEFDIAGDGTVARWREFCTPERIAAAFFGTDH